MKKVIRGFIITAVVMIIVGIALCVGGAFAGGISATQSVVRDMVEDGDFEFEVGITEVFRDERYTRFSKYDVDKLVIDVEAANVVLNEKFGQEDIGVHTEGRKFEVDLKGETLYIKSNSATEENKVELYFPADFYFEEVEITMGASEMKITGLNTNDFHAEIGAGELDVYEGNVKDFSVDIGMGDFEYEGIIKGDCDLDCGMGNMELRLEGSKEDFNYEIDCAAGNVTVGNESFAGFANAKEIEHGADADMDIDCGMGNVIIEF